MTSSRRPSRRAFRRTASVSVLLLALVGCALDGLDFVQDTRVTITSPSDLEEVTPPVEVRWTVEDFEVLDHPDGSRSRDRGRFAVLVDRDPMPPGEGLAWFARGDETCRSEAGCPDDTWLATQSVFVTSATEMVIDGLRDRRDDGRGLDRHTVTVVLLDGADRRIGEAAFSTEFVVAHAAEGQP